MEDQRDYGKSQEISTEPVQPKTKGQTLKIGVCKECGRGDVGIKAKGMCRRCYNAYLRADTPAPLPSDGIITVDFEQAPELLRELVLRAENELRSLSNQIVWELKLAMK